ncbi:MAG: hypothetical protein HY854_25060 [Burkholderiales bacterium]|nr:hypothetical protein [Burkholderiales bacterium]
MTHELDDVQRIVLHGTPWVAARHLVLSFPARTSAPHFLEQLHEAGLWPASSDHSRDANSVPDIQVSLGFSRPGLEHARVPRHVLSLFALKAPAFHAGAAIRASTQLGASGGRPREWLPAYHPTEMDAVISVHGKSADAVEDARRRLCRIACDTKVHTHDLLPALRLPTPQGESDAGNPLWTHFGFRDGLSRIGILDWTSESDMAKCREGSKHRAGEFVLGHQQDSGANPWIAGPDKRVWPQSIRGFFRNGSFGVLHQVHQDAEAFEQYVASSATHTGLSPAEIKAKLCGRYTDGRPLVSSAKWPEDDKFDYKGDPQGLQCPFGSHVRRMNPRGDDLAHNLRKRPLLRRGLPYGGWTDKDRGLMGQFFCASIEDQFEHLVGQWGDRVPLGSPDAGGARDPMFGAHSSADDAFVIPLKNDMSFRLRGMGAFATTLGIAYLFYPSLSTLRGIARSRLWRPDKIREDEDSA